MWRTVVLILMVGLATPAEAEMYKGYETPTYTVQKAEGAFEIRLYQPHIAAEVMVEGSRTAAIGAGFRLLAGYIFGGNQARAKVAMTTPVAQSASEQIAMTTPVAETGAGQGWSVQFMMPSAYTLDSLPKPDDARIRFVTMPPVRKAVLRFSGLAGTSVLAARTQELRLWAEAQGVTVQGKPQFLFYDGPATLPWKKRNEVAFVLAD